MAEKSLVQHNFRLNPKLLQKLRYFAEENECSVQQAVRDILWQQVKDCRQPENPVKHELSASAAKLQSYRDLAAHHGVELNELVIQVLDRLVSTHLPK